MRRVAGALLGFALTLTACGGDDGETTLTVLAAASLTDAFTDLADRFERDHDGVAVDLVLAGSPALVARVNAGGPGDVIATADRSTMDAVDGAGPPTIVARNRLAIIVEPGNPKGITGIGDLGRDDIVLVLCAAEVPCGSLAAAALARAGVDADPASLEEHAKGVVAKVALGEADAGVAYATDRGDLGLVEVGDAGDPALEAVYPMAVLAGSEHPELARAWVAFVTSPGGRTVLRSHGFLDP